MNNRYQEITDVLQRYFDGLYYCDIAILETVFHPKAQYATTSSGALLHYDMPTYMNVIKDRTPPADTGDPYGFEITSIQFAGNDTAHAVLQCTIMGKHFTDFLSLVRTQSNWQIIAKVFHFDLAA